MRVNVYTEEILLTNKNGPIAEIVTADYISSRTGESMTNYGLRIYLASAPELHNVKDRDDDRSAVTFWCGAKEKNIMTFLEMIKGEAGLSSLERWRDKVADEAEQAETAYGLR